MLLKVIVTAEHIQNAKYPNSSPIALALREMSFDHVSVNHHYAYVDTRGYRLPQIATESEILFDYLAQGGKQQGEIIKQVLSYEFEMEELEAIAS